MNGVEDDYAALESYIQLVETEIDEVISGCRVPERCSTTDTPLQSSNSLRGQAPVPLEKKLKRVREGNASKPPSGSRRDSRGSVKKDDSSEGRKKAACFGVAPTARVLDGCNDARSVDVKTARMSAGSMSSSVGRDWLTQEADDLRVVEERDLLLERILGEEERKRQRDERALRIDDSIPRRNSGGALAVIGLPQSTTFTEQNKRLTDLHKLLDSDRNALLLGSGILPYNDVMRCANQYRRHQQPHACSQSLPSVHQCNHNRQMHTNFNGATDTGGRSALDNNGPESRRHSLQSCHYSQHQQQLSPDYSSSGKDLMDELRRKKRAEVLHKIYDDVKCINRLVSPPTYQCPTPHIVSPQNSSARHSLGLNEVDSRTAFNQGFPEGTNRNGYSGVISNSNSVSERKHKFDFDIPEPNPAKVQHSKLTRRSYPSDNSLVILPPPGFDSSSSEEDAMVNVRVVSGRLGEMIDHKNKVQEQDAKLDTVQHYAEPLEFEPIPDHNNCLKNCAVALNNPNVSHINNLQKTDSLKKFGATDDEDKVVIQVSRSCQDESLSLPQACLAQVGISGCQESKGPDVCAWNTPGIPSTGNVTVKEQDPCPSEQSRISSTINGSAQEQDLFLSGMFSISNTGNGAVKKHDFCFSDISGIPNTSNGEVKEQDSSSPEIPGISRNSYGAMNTEISPPLCKTVTDHLPRDGIGEGFEICESGFIPPPQGFELPASELTSHDPLQPFLISQTPPAADGENTQTSETSVSRGGHAKATESEGVNSSHDVNNFELIDLVINDPDVQSDSAFVINLDGNSNFDNNNNNTIINLISMCLAGDCKHGTADSSSPAEQKAAELTPKTYLHIQAPDKQNGLTSSQETSKGAQFPPSGLSDEKLQCNSNAKKTDIESTPLCSNNCNTGGSEICSAKEHSCTETESKSEPGVTDQEKVFDELELSSIVDLTEASDKCIMKKSILKDTAVQTSLELEGFAVDISETLINPSETAPRANCETNEANDIRKTSISETEALFENKGVSNDDGDKHIKIFGHESSGEKSINRVVKEENEQLDSKSRNQSRVSFLRSKSVHGSGDNGNGSTPGRSLRPEASSLSGSLRELSHLNIDVSQRLVDGERTFVVNNGSPELQVVVNALTPVLSRRNRSRNARRVQNALVNTESSYKAPTSASDRDDKPNISESESRIDATAGSNIQNSTDNNNDKNGSAFDTLPINAMHQGIDESHNKTSIKDNSSPKEPHPDHHGRLRKPIYQISQTLSQISTPGVTIKVPDFAPSEADKPNLPKFNLPTGLQLELDLDDLDLDEEIERSKSSLFISPKHANTWHGASSSHTLRSAPKMGVGWMPGDGVKFICGPDGRIRPVAVSPSSSPSSSPTNYHQSAYTMPVISRTLLDALHKRYCAHQYSSHYQSLQPFSLLKLDPAFNLQNQSGTALLVKPRPVYEHEVQAAPPSPQMMARLRMLTAACESFKDSDKLFDKDQSVSPQLPRLPDCDSKYQQRSALESPLQKKGFTHNQKKQGASKVMQRELFVSDSSVTPDSSPNLRDRLNHGSKHQAELEAAEAVKWLRAAGFPQYAQMFEDGQFPVDMGVVERDHDFLDSDSIKSLFRRLVTLNKYAGMKLDSHPGKKATSEEDDEDDLCALSERWEYQKSVRRWSRKDLSPSSRKSSCTETEQGELAARSGSHDSLLADQDSGSQTGDSPLLESRMPHQGNSEMVSLSRGEQAVAEVTAEDMDQADSALSPRLRRAASEKIKTAKNLFKKMEGLKSKKTRRQLGHRDIVEISGPVVADKETMQAKLERMNCVDISPTSPTPRGGKPFNGIHRSSFAGHSSHRTPSDVSSSQISQQSASYSARPHSDFLSNPVEVKCPSTTQFTSASQTPDSRSGPTSPTQHSSLSHESSLDEYHAAHSVLLRNLQSVQGDGTAVPKRNNSDTNLLEIFLVPQDHKPGRFPRILQNGYIETEACGTAVNARTGSVRLGRGTCLASDYNSSNSSAPLSRNQALGYRVSVYDNFLPSEGKKEEDQETSGGIPGVVELGLSGNVNHQEGIDNSKPGFVQGQSSDIGFISHDNSQGRVGIASDPDTQVSAHERSVSLESSTSLRTPREGTPASEGGVISEDSQNSRKSSQDSATKSRGVAHSSSLDSYFRGSSGVRNEVSSRETSEESTSSQFQQDYDEFDRILQQLYQNINDMTNFMGMNRQEKSAKLVRAATSPLPASCKDQISPMHVAKHPTQPVVSTRVSTASSTVHSSETQRSPLDTSVSIDSYGGFEQDQDNVSSAGEGSNTAESGSEDQEAALTDMSHDDSLDQIPEVSRERRDSGVGHSLTRATGDRRRKKIRWHSFQKCHRPDVTSRAMQINSLTVGQLVRLQKLSLLRLTGIMEKCLPVSKSGWNWMLPRFMKRNKVPDFSDKNVFGVPLSIMAQRTGQPLPQCVLYAMRYLRRTCQNAVGIFRKSGVKSKIQQLRDYLEAHPDTTDFEGMNAYNVADMLKTYFRDLPECLLTNKMSETFRSIYTYVPQSQRLEAIQAAILLLPDENREVLQSILLFLSDISSHEADHQMNASNLAVCFTPTVFQLGLRQNLPYSPKRNRKNTTGIPDPREIMEQKAAHECLLMMITECKKLFTVAPNLFRQLQVQSLAYMEPTPLQDIGSSPSEVRAFGQERIQMVLKESHDKNRGWIQTSTIGDVEIFHRKPMDDCPLKEWKLVVDVEAPPIEVLRRIMHERHTWDEDMLSWSVVERLDPHSDVFQFVLNSMAPHPSRNFCVLRYWRSDLSKGACALITISVEHSDALEVQGVWAADLGTYYLMEPCGSGRARVTFLTRVDTRGRMPEWYTKIFGHISANFLERLKESFKQDASGPETKV